MKKFFGNILLFFHTMPMIIMILLVLLIIFGIKINKIISFFIVLYTTLIIVGWIFFGNCILTPIENYLFESEEKYNNGTKKSHIIIIIQNIINIDDYFIYYFFIYLNIFLLLFFLIHILFL